MTVEHAHTVDNGVYQQPTCDDHMGSRPGGPAAAVVEFLDEEHGGYKTPDVAPPVASATTLGEKLNRILVLHDFRNAEVWRAAVFEGVATFAMTFVGILTTISTLRSSFSHPVVAIAIFQGLVLSLCILASAPATGGHVNPCITWTETLTGHITPVRGSLYISFQILGSIVASVMAKTVVGETLAKQYSLGGCYLHSQGVGLESGRAFLVEMVLAFFVLFISYSVALDPPRLPRTGYTLAPFIVGGIVGLCIFAGETWFLAMAAPGLILDGVLALRWRSGGAMWKGHWVFWLGPGASGLIMAALYWNIPPTHVQVYKLRKAARAKRGIKSSDSKNVFPFGSVLGSSGRIRNNTRSSGSQDQNGQGGSKTTISFQV